MLTLLEDLVQRCRQVRRAGCGRTPAMHPKSARKKGATRKRLKRLKTVALIGRWGPFTADGSAMRTGVGQRTASPSLFRSRPFGFVNRKMFSFRSNHALF